MNATPPPNVAARGDRLFSWREIAAGLAAALLLSLALATILGWLNLNESRRVYNTQATSIVQLISQRLAADRAVLTPLSGLYQASALHNTHQLLSVGSTLLRSYPYFSNFAYLRWLTADARQPYVAQMRERGYPQFRIHPLGEPEGIVSADAPALIVSFLAPLTPHNARHLGADLLSNPRIAKAVEYAIRSGRMAVVDVPHFNGDHPGYLALMATYYGFHPPRDAQQRQRQLSGMFMVSVDFPSMLDDIEIAHPRWGLSIFNPEGDTHSPRLIYRRSMPSSGMLSSWLPGYRIERQLNVDHHRLLIRLDRHTAFSDVRPGTIVPAMLLPWMFIGALGWVTGLRRQARHAQQAAERELAHSREQAEIALSSITDAVITTDARMRVQFMNPVATRLTGWPMAMAIGHPLDTVAMLRDERTHAPMSVAPEHVATFLGKSLEGELRARDGRSHAVEIRFTALTRGDDAAGGLALVLRDLSRERELEDALDYQSSRDPLTGLLNRRSFETYLRQWLSLCQPKGSDGALCQVDLNHFKLVNDTAGHRAGDELLRQFAWLLDTVLPSGTVLARLGADEFGLLLPPNAVEPPERIAEQLIEAARAFDFSWEQQHFNIGVSIGLVRVADARQDAGDLLVMADLACLAAKDRGRNNLHIYDAGDKAIAHRSGQMLWLTRLQEALHDERFVLYTQPMLPLNAEARPRELHEFLLRMHLDDGSLAAPNLFIPAAERYQLMAELDRRIIDLALALVARSAGSPHDTLYTINLSGQSVGDPHLAGYVFERLRHHGVNPGQICFEITETAAISNMHGAQTLIRQLRARGVRFALDDFGAGLSSFTYLKRLPVDFLKIEGEFVRGMLQDATDRSLVESFCEIGRAFGLHIIAESVEDEATLDLLRQIGVDYVQGFHIGRPRPAPFAAPTRMLNADPGTSAV
ncbi:bifunctional diguanylate cyclase/phosphodiesterase [Acidihalobacter prosperus]|uniref:Diguanylate cyclase n=1 Tax=Acidihalobacter prosperus TaxID=160660 RepID=A0A1A6C186_9GAMM|nr:EAL domain-containing protein [Acidihalobacter prosperus]OBS08315.1 hypothetical protein Thpro_022565 [Acidihalobacter prosperus]